MSNEINVLTPYELYVCSFYDKVGERSVLVSMHETTGDAIRRFEKACSAAELSDIKKDLVLYRIGVFNTRTLEITPIDKDILKEGVDVISE